MKECLYSLCVCSASIGIVLTIISSIGFAIENHLELMSEETTCTVLSSTIYIDICTRSECDDDDCVYYDVDCWYASYVVSYDTDRTGSLTQNSTLLVSSVNSFKYYLYSYALEHLNDYPVGSVSPCWYNTEDPFLVSFERYDATGWRVFFIVSLAVMGSGWIGIVVIFVITEVKPC
eukprot:TRINITY_DN1979_c0_g2_i1.p1 TRINITY_DN1979_c0_g2~~TRINITY_DN1979_c0_g2_i1.p1  ORF type:complete len:176 (+),score=18.75 TRINITY_DN1979_c0_g2_i1:318-845(+)